MKLQEPKVYVKAYKSERTLPFKCDIIQSDFLYT